MNAFTLLEYAAWIISAGLGLWMLIDMVKVNSRFSEDVLLSSREGDIEDHLVIDPEHQRHR